jgi:AraC-like DNA-binding protein
MTCEAYQMYCQGITHKEIAQHFHWGSPSNARRIVKEYALQNDLIYPIQKDYSVVYGLYVNGMSLGDIGRFMGITTNGARRRLQRYCFQKGLENPCVVKKLRPQRAYEIRQRTQLPYSQIAKMVGYASRKQCWRAVKAYERSLNP